MLKKMISFIILTLILFSSLSIPLNAWTLNEAEGLTDAYYLYNFENELILSQKNTDKIISANSTVKMMTACIALESGIPLDTLITINSDMISNEGRFMGLRVGDKLTFGDLLHCMIGASFNDATYAIALTVCDSIGAFLEKMNQKAKYLHMDSTNYVDITGLSEESKTTVNDTVKLSTYLIKNEAYKTISSTKSYQLSSSSTCEYNKITNRSSLISSYKGLHNFNTGSSLNDSDTSIVYINTGTISLLCIVMNASSDPNNSTNIAETYVKRMISHGLYDYSNKVVIKANSLIDSLPVKYSISDNEVDIYVSEDVKAYISDDINISEDLTYNYYLYESGLKAPLKSGEDVGMVIISHNGKYVASSKLIVKENVDRNIFLYLMELMKSFITGKIFLFSSLIFLILMAVYYFKTKESLDRMYKHAKRKTLKYYRK